MPKFKEHDCHLMRQEENVVKQLIDTGLFITIRRKFRSWFIISKSHPRTSRYFKSHSACRTEQIRHLFHYYKMIHPFSLFSLFWEFYAFWIFTNQQIFIAGDSVFDYATDQNWLFFARFTFDVMQLSDIAKMFFTGYYDHVKSKVILDSSRIANLFWEFYAFLIFTSQQAFIAVDSAFDYATDKQVLFLGRFVNDVMQLSDIAKMFFTGYYDHVKSKVILDSSRIAKRYVLTFFFPDISSCLYTFTDILKQHGVFDIPYYVTLILLIFTRFKICRLPRSLKAIELFREYMGFSSHLFKGIKVLFIFLVVIFWCFSIHFFMDEQVGIYMKENYTDEDNIFESYYEATLLLLLINFAKGDLEVLLEYANVIFFLCFGFALQLFLYAQLLQVWTKYSSSENRHHSLQNQFKQYVQYKELPITLRERIFMYFQFKFHNYYFRESDINNMISPLVKQEILLHDTRTHIEKVDFFRFFPENILMKVISHLKTEIFLPGDVIIRAGTVGTSMFFIHHGSVAIYTPTGKEVCHLEDGAHFGEIALVLSEKRVASVVAIAASELFVLTRADFQAAIDPYPEFRDQLIALAAERLNKTMMQSQTETGS